MPSLLKTLPLYAYSSARSAHFASQYIFFNTLPLLLPGTQPYRPRRDLATLNLIRKELAELLREDAQGVADGMLPARALLPESPLEDALRYPRMLWDSYQVYRRRVRGEALRFDAESRQWLDEVPRYYRRNFHFQTGGYLSERSAESYDYQVEMLFLGAADAMRRLILRPLREAFGPGDGKGLRLLEIGAGTGSATRFVRMAFPKARITAVDLSEPYLRAAGRRLTSRDRVDLLRADGTDLPFRNGEFDAVYSVFLFHELPLAERRKILSESGRILKKGGLFALVDSIQLGDRKEFDRMLRDFPRLFHEPYFRDYVSRPMEKLVNVAGFRGPRTRRGLYSKAIWARK